MNKQRMFSLNVFLTLAIWLNACPPSPGKLEIRVSNEKFQTHSDMIVTGKNFTPSKPVTITIGNFPRSEGNITRNVTADPNSGNFTLRAEFAYRTVDRNEEFINILVTARDETTGQFVIENVSPEPYLIRR